jgi:hypothetical protein
VTDQPTTDAPTMRLAAAAMAAQDYEDGYNLLSSMAATIEAEQPEPATPADVTVYELRAGTDTEPDHVATYATEQAAAAHGEHLYRAACGTIADLEWRPTGTDDTPRYRLVAVDDLDGEETDTDWHIVQVTVPAAYTPAGGEQQ